MEELMRVPATSYENNEVAAREVAAYAKKDLSSFRRFSLLPFNRFLREFTEWWLVPAKSERPAFKPSKMCFHRYPRSSEALLFVGYLVEKGVDAKLSALPGVNKKDIMQGDWYWHNFIQQARGGAFDNTLRNLHNSAQCPISILLEAYEFNKVPTPEGVRKEPRDRIEFIVHLPNLVFEASQLGKEILSRLNSCTDLKVMAKQLPGIRDLDYFWVDLVIGIRLRYGPSQSIAWSTADIWNKALEPWISWVH